MKHLVLMKFDNDYLNVETVEKIKNTFSLLETELPDDILSQRVFENCVTRDSNMDIMIELELKGEDSLSKYLNHPAHIAIGREMNPHIIMRCSFDYN